MFLASYSLAPWFFIFIEWFSSWCFTCHYSVATTIVIMNNSLAFMSYFFIDTWNLKLGMNHDLLLSSYTNLLIYQISSENTNWLIIDATKANTVPTWTKLGCPCICGFDNSNSWWCCDHMLSFQPWVLIKSKVWISLKCLNLGFLWKLKGKKAKVLWGCSVLAVIWVLWMERNSRILKITEV